MQIRSNSAPHPTTSTSVITSFRMHAVRLLTAFQGFDWVVVQCASEWPMTPDPWCERNPPLHASSWPVSTFLISDTHMFFTSMEEAWEKMQIDSLSDSPQLPERQQCPPVVNQRHTTRAARILQTMQVGGVVQWCCVGVLFVRAWSLSEFIWKSNLLLQTHDRHTQKNCLEKARNKHDCTWLRINTFSCLILPLTWMM